MKNIIYNILFYKFYNKILIRNKQLENKPNANLLFRFVPCMLFFSFIGKIMVVYGACIYLLLLISLLRILAIFMCSLYLLAVSGQ